MTDRSADSRFMRRALALAKRAWGKTTPNPMVGAVIVKDGRIIGEGYHHKASGDRKQHLPPCHRHQKDPEACKRPQEYHDTEV